MKIIVTGSSGFLGAELCAFLCKCGHNIVEINSKNCDLTDKNNLESFNFNRYDIIYHLAAWTQAGDFCIKYPGDQWIINQQINTNILSWWAKYQSQAKLVFMGTSCVYDPAGKLTESEYMHGEPIDSLYTYAMTKRMLYQGARALSKQYNLKYLCAVPSTLYGSGYHTDGRQMHFIFDLIRKIIRGKEFGEKVTLWGDGNQKREIIHVNDFVNILCKLTEKYDNQIFNIGAGQEYSIKYFAQTICEIIEYPFENIEFDTSKYVGALSKCLNIEKIKTSMPEFQLKSMNEGLRETIQWFYDKEAYKLIE